MTRSRIRWILAASLLAMAPAFATAQNGHASWATLMSSEAQQAAKAVDAFHAELARGDGAAAAKLVTEDALIFEGGHAERSRSE